jgi:surfactin synthase thioesterase subunit
MAASLVESLSALLGEFDEALSNTSDLPLVLFDYSFGALVAYLRSQRMAQRGSSLAGLIVVSTKTPVHAGTEKCCTNTRMLEVILKDKMKV